MASAGAGKANGEPGGDWSPSSWRACPIQQAVQYPDPNKLVAVEERLRALPPLVTAGDVENLRDQLAQVAEGKRFLLQGGDCAERFLDCTASSIEKKLRIMLQMSLVLTWGARTPTVRVARMAGQYAKPRSNPTELVDGKEVMTFRGDLVNGFDVNERDPDPERLLQGYHHAATTLNFANGLIRDGFADIHDAASWNMGFLDKKKIEYEHVVEEVLDSLNFAHTCGINKQARDFQSVDLFVSHEGLTLQYEEGLTRFKNGKYYNLGAQFLWIGDRTRQLDHAHVEYFRGIANPIGVKVGPKATPKDMVDVVRRLWPNPSDSPGKLTLITRMGADKVEEFLPPFIKAFQEAKLPVVWVCDPCHGNTHQSASGYKTRDVEKILLEISRTFEVHEKLGSHLGGVHFELTGENVTECIGGPEELKDSDLPRRYTTYCDPRLNYAQSMEVAFLLSRLLAQHRRANRVRIARPLPPPEPEHDDKDGEREAKRRRQ